MDTKTVPVDSTPGFFDDASLNTASAALDRASRKRAREDIEALLQDDEKDDGSVGHDPKRSRTSNVVVGDGGSVLAPSSASTSLLTRVDFSKYDFFLVMYNSTPFKNLVDLISPVLERCTFRIMKKPGKHGKPGFAGVTINSMDSNTVSMIIARLKCDEVYPPNLAADTSFCVSTDMFSTLVRSIKPGSSMELKKFTNKAEVYLKGYNPNRKNYMVRQKIPTLDADDQFPKIDIIGYKYVVDIDLQTLRGIVKIAQNQRISASKIRFRIYKNNRASNSDTQITKVKITVDAGVGGPSTTSEFRSVTKWDSKDDQQTVITTSDMYDDEDGAVEDEVLQKVFDEKFSTKHLHLFLKSMDRPSIILRFSDGKPLVIVYPLGGEETVGYCNFILAPVRKSEEEDDAASDSD
jgi:hypothetical protein